MQATTTTILWIQFNTSFAVWNLGQALGAGCVQATISQMPNDKAMNWNAKEEKNVPKTMQSPWVHSLLHCIASSQCVVLVFCGITNFHI